MAALLDVSNVVVRFGGIVALDGVTFEIDEGQIVAVGRVGAAGSPFWNATVSSYELGEKRPIFQTFDYGLKAREQVTRVAGGVLSGKQ